MALSLNLLHHPEQNKDHRDQGGLIWSDGVFELSGLKPGPLAWSGTVSIVRGLNNTHCCLQGLGEIQIVIGSSQLININDKFRHYHNSPILSASQ